MPSPGAQTPGCRDRRASTNFGRGAYFSVQTYHYDLSRHVYQRSFGRHEYGRYGYPRMAEYVQQHDRPDFIWCADIQDGTEPLYVDQVHYGRRCPRASRAASRTPRWRGGSSGDASTFDAAPARCGSGLPPRR